jgi:small subunit ribosomal protein S4
MPKLLKNKIKYKRLMGLSRKSQVSLRASKFSVRLRSKQNLRVFYGGISNRNLTRLYTNSKKQTGDFSSNLVTHLERRLDIVLFRMNLVTNVLDARQLISHGSVTVNNIKVHSPDYKLSPGDFIQRDNITRENECKHMEYKTLPYLEVNYNTLCGIFTRVPEKKEIVYPSSLNLAEASDFLRLSL